MFVSSCANNQDARRKQYRWGCCCRFRRNSCFWRDSVVVGSGSIQSSTLYNVDTNSIDSLIQPTETFDEAEGVATNILTEIGQTDENGLLTFDVNSYLPTDDEFLVIYSATAFDTVVREVMAAKLLGVASTDEFGESYNEVNLFFLQRHYIF